MDLINHYISSNEYIMKRLDKIENEHKMKFKTNESIQYNLVFKLKHHTMFDFSSYNTKLTIYNNKLYIFDLFKKKYVKNYLSNKIILIDDSNMYRKFSPITYYYINKLHNNIKSIHKQNNFIQTTYINKTTKTIYLDVNKIEFINIKSKKYFRYINNSYKIKIYINDYYFFNNMKNNKNNLYINNYKFKI